MLKVYNTMTRTKEEFKPVKEGEVSIYCCGVTPYNPPHIGNARPFVTWDVIRRYFAKRGYKVKYIQNFTDVDDKIIAAANREFSTWKEISERNIKSYFYSMDALNVRHADFYPKVSETMPEIISMIQKLVDKGFAYKLDNGDVYFSVEKDNEYGKLSGRKLDDMQAGARIEVDDRKNHPMDFALWKAAKSGEPSWESPWGAGRPGWHIECSAMSLKFLGEKFDFHGGGSDLIFPHHENEIAQSQCSIGDSHSFAQYWLHNGFITIDNEKMSKSAGNFFTVEDILKKYPGEVIRFFLLQTHYRSPLNFSEDAIKEAQTSLQRLKNSHDAINSVVSKIASDKIEFSSGENSSENIFAKSEEILKSFYVAMDDDFNTALAIGKMFDLAREINIYCNDFMGGKISITTDDSQKIVRVKEIFAEMSEIIGIFEREEKSAAGNSGLVEKLMNVIISIRADARAAKNWTVADKIRDELKKAGVTLEDTPQGVKWSIK